MSCEEGKKFFCEGTKCILQQQPSSPTMHAVSVLLFASLSSFVRAFGASQSQCSPTVASLLNSDDLIRTIRAGKVYQKHDFLNSDQIEYLLNDIGSLQNSGAFQLSGLSNTVKGKDQNFGKSDRAVCPVPWWSDSLKGDVASTSPATNPVSSQLVELRHFLATTLDRKTMHDANLGHECYYSVSGPGSSLSRHMDERHEEMKGAKGWLLPSRRSLSWLIYLSDPGWSLEKNGGGLRSFPQQHLQTPQEPTHEGNLQIGWLKASKGSVPVFLDSWFVPSESQDDNDFHQVLYVVDGVGEKRLLTKPWLSDWMQGISIADFLLSWVKQGATARNGSTGLFLSPIDAKNFRLLEDRPSWDEGKSPDGSNSMDVAPIRGSLVVFDSVMVPHQVELVKQGHRIALAGWFHEKTQPMPGFDA